MTVGRGRGPTAMSATTPNARSGRTGRSPPGSTRSTPGAVSAMKNSQNVRRSKSPVSKSPPTKPGTPQVHLVHTEKNTMNKNKLSTSELANMTEEELEAFINSNPDLGLTDQEIEYLFIRRARLALEGLSIEGDPVAEPSLRNDDPNSAPVFKVMVLGDEDSSGKIELLRRFTMPYVYEDGGHKNFKKFPDDLPPFDIQRVSIVVSADQNEELGSIFSDQSYKLELWAPLCYKEYNALRPLYYPATDVFVMVFNIQDQSAFANLRRFWEREVKDYFSTYPKKEVPVLLIGNYAECRGNPDIDESELVSPEQAVQMALECGMLKYIEVCSNDNLHVQEVFRQLVLGVSDARARNPMMKSSDYVIEFEKEAKILQTYLELQPPEGVFDLESSTFTLQPKAGATLLYTKDGSAPSRSSLKYNGPIKLSRPYPKQIQAATTARGRFMSRPTVFQVPEETPAPRGHFDLFEKTFVVHVELHSETKYYYTLDGSIPSLFSPVYNGVGIPLETGTPNYPATVTIVGKAPGMFMSVVAQFKTYDDFLEGKEEKGKFVHTPGKGNLYCAVMNPVPGLEYRYTLDGLAPNYWSHTYVKPFPVRASTKTVVKMAAFPKMMMASPTIEARISFQSDEKVEALFKPPTGPAVPARPDAGPSAPGQTLGPPTSPVPKPVHTGPGGVPGFHLPMEQHSPTAPPPSQAHLLDVEWSRVPPPGAHPQGREGIEWMAKCKAEGSSVTFTFEKQVCVQRVVVTTPGNQLGPGGYNVSIYTDGSPHPPMTIARGTLEDVRDEQIIELGMAQRRLSCTSLRVDFDAPPGKTDFELMDIHIHGDVAPGVE